MPVNKVELNTTFNEWRNIINQFIDLVGDESLLNTTDKTSIVNAVNEIITILGDTSLLNTDIVDEFTITNTNIGDLFTLNTTDKTSIVNAVNQITVIVGNLIDLNTTNKTNIINAINEVLSKQITDFATTNTNIGDLFTLNTTDKTSIVNSINEIQNVSSTNDTALINLTNNVGVLTGDVGDLTTLSTSNKTSLPEAINEVNDSSLKKVNYLSVNNEINNGRFTNETTKNISIFDSNTISLREFNSSVITESDKFIDDNSNNGGSGGTLTANVVSLLSELSANGRVNLQNGFEFYIASITAGGGTSNVQNVSSLNYYPVVQTDESFLGSIGDKVSYRFWVKLDALNDVANNGIILGDSTVDTYINGVLSNEYLLDNIDTWVHVTQVATLDTEYKKFFPIISANVNDIIHIALPSLQQSEHKGIHVGVM